MYVTVIVVYDISTKDAAGKKRLNRVSRICRNFGIAMQNSVYECEVDAAQYRTLQTQLISQIAPDEDSICFYLLGNRPHSRIARFGKERVLWNRQSYVI